MCFQKYAAFLLWVVAVANGNVRHPQSNKQFINQLGEGQFEIVHPFQMRDRKERIGIDTHNYFLNNSAHYKQIVLVIKSNVVFNERIRLKLILNLNEHIFYNATQFEKMTADGESFLSYKVENCYYQGTVNGDSTTFVAISTCNGLRGIIGFQNGTALGIWPLDGGDNGRRHPHVLYRTRWSRDAACGAATHTPQHSPLTRMPSKREIRKRDVTRQTKFVELAIIGDHAFTKEFNLTEDEAVEFMLESVNIADAMLARDLNVRLSVVYSEIWLDAQRVDLHSDIERTLSGAVEYITGHIYQVDKDASIMFTGGFFGNNEMLTSTFSSICTARAAAVVKVLDSYTVHNAAQFVAHSVAHIIGIDHDSADCICSHQLPCIMNKQTGAIGSPFIWQFSKCSVARMHNVLQSGHIQCLLNRPFQISQLHQCGNGIVDGDEECDCGQRDECSDPCCDPITCTLRAHAQCAAHHSCCHRCELRKAGHLCRAARSSCDVPETCDGISGDCPPDGYLVDGIQCGLNGHCWKGNCSDPEQQCQSLWGDGSKAGEEPCYDHNEKGVEYGNCGKDRNGQFISCEAENKRCGTLHCRGGSSVPLYSNLTSFNFQFLNDGRQIQCKSITNVGVGLVSDGTSCGSGRICVEGTCLPLAQVSPPVHCPSNNLALQCSGHGDCTTTQSCLCYDGWSGVACDVRSNSTRRPFMGTDPARKSSVNLIIPAIKLNKSWDDTTVLLGILILIGIFLLLLLICLLCCYRRRTSAVFQRPTFNDKADESFQDDGNRVIKFGSTPSWAKEKRSLKKNKHVYGALQRINEANEERDSASVKSRESNAQLNGSAINAIVMERTHADDLSLRRQIQRHVAEETGGSAFGLDESQFIEPPTVPVFADDAHSAINRGMSPLISSSPSHYVSRRRPIEPMLDASSSAAFDSPLLNNGGPLPLYATGQMYNRTRVPPSASMASPSGSSRSERSMGAPLKFSSFNAMLKQIDSDQLSEKGTEESRPSNGDHFTFLRTEVSNNLPDPPPASADSGHPGSQYDIRESPPLFSDPFKLDVSNS